MSTESTVADVARTGLALLELGRAIGRGELPDPVEIAKALAALAVSIAPVDDLKGYLDEADRARIDFLVDLSAEAKLGPRP